MGRIAVVILALALAGSVGSATHAGPPSTFVVDTTSDANLTGCTGAGGDCSLRGAINRANSNGPGDHIEFDPSVFPPGPPTAISLGSGLPPVTGGDETIGVFLASVVLDAIGEPSNFPCLTLASDGNVVTGLQFTDCDRGVWIMSGSGNFLIANTFYDNSNGIFVSSNSNRIVGNNIGINSSGTALPAVAGNFVGIRIEGADNLIGGQLPQDKADGNTIARNHDGVVITTSGGSGNVLRNNHIGTDVTGTVDLGNEAAGVNLSHYFTGSAPAANLLDLNVISGNGLVNVFIADAGTSENTLTGNIIGPDQNGSGAAMTNGVGVQIAAGATDNTIGAGNVISDNTSGVHITGAGTTENNVHGNNIGTNVVASGAVPNSNSGVLIDGGASNNTVGGDSASERNTISGNANDGIGITGPGASGNQVLGNFIGTNGLGMGAIGNTFIGIRVQNGAAENVIHGNVVSGNGFQGVCLCNTTGGDGAVIASGIGIGGGNQITGNFVGTNATGTGAIPNGENGVLINASPDNIIGGATAASRNVISGNTAAGVLITNVSATGNHIVGNYIGVSGTGDDDLGNGDEGVLISLAPGNLVRRNVISGNGDAVPPNVTIDGASATANQVAGNYIGTNAAGTAAIGPIASQGGVVLTSPGNLIGGTTTDDRNVISGVVFGIEIGGPSGVNEDGNTVQGNFIGTDATGTEAIGNGSGVRLRSNGNMVGGTTPGARNVIASAFNAGVSVQGDDNIVAGNFIGTDVTGTSELANGSGISLVFTPADNVIGGTEPGAGNLIAFNTHEGIYVESGSGNGIIGNSIHSNGELGIELIEPGFIGGVTPNDPGDVDTGANNLQNYPELTSADAGGGMTVVRGTIDTILGIYRIEFFASSECDPAGHGEGETLVGSIQFQVSQLGELPIDTSLGVIVPTGQYITTTATDSSGNTSEFSNCVEVVGPTPTPTPPPSSSPTSTPSTQTPGPSPTQTATPTPGSPTPTPTGGELVWGDHNCADGVGAVDSLLTLRHDAGLGANTGECPGFGDAVPAGGPTLVWGDIDCDGAIGAVDALKLLRHDAGLPVQQEEGCPEIGEPIG